MNEVGAPVNVVMGLADTQMSVNQLEDLGVKRVSIDGSLARTTFGLVRRAAAEIRDHGTFDYAPDIIRDAKSPGFSGCSDSWPLQPTTTLHQYPAKIRPPALGLELGRFQIACGAPTATAHSDSSG